MVLCHMLEIESNTYKMDKNGLKKRIIPKPIL